MKVIYVTSSLPYGPGEAFIIPEIQELKRKRHEVLLVPMYPRGIVFHKEAKILLDFTRTQKLLSWEIIKASLKILAQAPLKALSVLALLRQSRSLRILSKNLLVYPKGLWLACLVRAWQADHIHAHWASTTATMVLVAGELSGVPWSITAHRWDIVENNLLPLKASRAAFVRAIDRRGAQEFAAYANMSNWIPRVIHMGVILPQALERNRIPQPGDMLRVIMAANYVEIKGHIYLIEAVRLLRLRGVSVCLDLAGDGPLRTNIECMVRDYKMEDNLCFLGYVLHEHLLAQLQAGVWDLMVLPSIEDNNGAREGIPVSLMEAMSCGIPVISTNTGGIPELLSEGAGMLVPPKDALALADAIERLARNPKLRLQLAEVGRQRVHESFNLEKVVAGLAELFASCGKAID